MSLSTAAELVIFHRFARALSFALASSESVTVTSFRFRAAWGVMRHSDSFGFPAMVRFYPVRRAPFGAFFSASSTSFARAAGSRRP